MNYFEHHPDVGQVGFPSPQHIAAAYQRLQAYGNEHSPAVVRIYDLIKQSTVHTNLSLLDLLGYSAEQIQGMSLVGIASLIHPDDLEAVADYFQQFSTLSGETVMSLDYRMMRADGTWGQLRSHETALVELAGGGSLQVMSLIQEISNPNQSTSFQQNQEERLHQLLEFMLKNFRTYCPS